MRGNLAHTLILPSVILYQLSYQASPYRARWWVSRKVHAHKCLFLASTTCTSEEAGAPRGSTREAFKHSILAMQNSIDNTK